jgi:hypothetical protein
MSRISTDRVFGIVAGLLVGIVLSLQYEMSPWMLTLNRAQSLVCYLAIPMFSGFVSAVLEKTPKVWDSLFVGFFAGGISLVIGLAVAAENAFVGRDPLSVWIFALVSLVSWMLTSGIGAVLAKQARERP